MHRVSNELPIGIFDSGVGGLTVMKETMAAMPGESVMYLGDTARVPYGIRSPETVSRYSLDSSRFLIDRGIKILVVACNTSSSVSLDLLKEELPVPVIGVVKPGARAAVDISTSKKIAVIGTEATIRSGSYEKAIKSIDDSISVYGVACSLLVPLIEEGWTDGEVVTLTAKKYLSPLKNNGTDTMVLGCTHYPIIKNVIASVAGIPLIDSAVETAKEVRNLLQREGKLCPEGKERAVEFFVTDSIDKFAHVGERFLGHKITNISKIALGG